MNRDPDLEHSFERLATESPREAANATEQRILAAFRARRKHVVRRMLYGAIAAACLAVALLSIRSHRAAPHRSSTNQTSSLAYGFVALPYAQSDVPLEQAIIVRVQLPPSAWGALNVPPPPAGTGAVNADLLIGQDGVARAVRLIDTQ
jgi:hypothetical protein